MGILSDQGWKSRRMTAKFLDGKEIHGENLGGGAWHILDRATVTVDSTIAWKGGWRECLAVVEPEKGFKEESRLTRRVGMRSCKTYDLPRGGVHPAGQAMEEGMIGKKWRRTDGRRRTFWRPKPKF